jgi:hypothetical protein
MSQRYIPPNQRQSNKFSGYARQSRVPMTMGSVTKPTVPTADDFPSLGLGAIIGHNSTKPTGWSKLVKQTEDTHVANQKREAELLAQQLAREQAQRDDEKLLRMRFSGVPNPNAGIIDNSDDSDSLSEDEYNYCPICDVKISRDAPLCNNCYEDNYSQGHKYE